MFQNNIPESTATCLKPRRMRKGSLVIELPSTLAADNLPFEEMLSPFAKKLCQEFCQSVEYKEKFEKLDFVFDSVAVDDLLSKGWVAISDPPTKEESPVLTGVSTMKKTSFFEIIRDC